MLTNFLPRIFYANLEEALEFFVEGLRFEVLQRDPSMAVILRDDAKAYLVDSSVSAAVDSPELSIDTDDIDAIYAEISTRAACLLHPNSSTVSLKPWGTREFSVQNKSGDCVTFREWPKI